jgi:hypothetical protein
MTFRKRMTVLLAIAVIALLACAVVFATISPTGVPTSKAKVAAVHPSGGHGGGSCAAKGEGKSCSGGCGMEKGKGGVGFGMKHPGKAGAQAKGSCSMTGKHQGKGGACSASGHGSACSMGHQAAAGTHKGTQNVKPSTQKARAKAAAGAPSKPTPTH